MVDESEKVKEDYNRASVTVSVGDTLKASVVKERTKSTSDDDPDDHAGEVQEHDHLYFTAEHPGLSFAGACFAHLLVLAALVACANFFGSSFFPFSSNGKSASTFR